MAKIIVHGLIALVGVSQMSGNVRIIRAYAEDANYTGAIVQTVILILWMLICINAVRQIKKNWSER